MKNIKQNGKKYDINQLRSREVFSPGVSSPWFSNGFAAGDADPLRIRPG
jgi:hypothetical protein